MSKTIAITGNSGKSIFSYFLGNALAQQGKKAIILATDFATPTFQLLLERGKKAEEKSLGKALASPIIEIKTTLDNMIPFANNKNLGVISYSPGETPETYPEIIESDVLALLANLGTVVDFIIIDTQTSRNKSDKYLLPASDIVLCLTTADIKGVAYRQSTSHYDSVNILLCNHKDSPVEDVLKTFDKHLKYILPYDTAASTIYNGKKLEEVCIGKKYKKVVEKIIKEVIAPTFHVVSTEEATPIPQ